MRILYFAWLRSTIGISHEEVTPPESVVDIASLFAWLRSRSPQYASALANPAVVKAAVNQEHVAHTHPVGPNDEVAFFPPVTGG